MELTFPISKQVSRPSIQVFRPGENFAVGPVKLDPGMHAPEIRLAEWLRREAEYDAEERRLIERSGLHHTPYFCTYYLEDKPDPVLMRIHRLDQDTLRGIAIFRKAPGPPFAPAEVRHVQEYLTNLAPGTLHNPELKGSHVP